MGGTSEEGKSWWWRWKGSYKYWVLRFDGLWWLLSHKGNPDVLSTGCHSCRVPFFFWNRSYGGLCAPCSGRWGNLKTSIERHSVDGESGGAFGTSLDLSRCSECGASQVHAVDQVVGVARHAAVADAAAQVPFQRAQAESDDQDEDGCHRKTCAV